MSRLPGHPTRTQSRRMASSLSLVVFAFLALVCILPAAVNADEASNKKAEYGTVIGIGELIRNLSSPIES